MDVEKSSISSCRSTSTTLMKDVYWWLCAGVGLTALTALMLVQNAGLLMAMYNSSVAMIMLVLAELGLVMVLSTIIQKLSFPMAVLLYSTYCILNGMTMASIFLVYTGTSIAGTFFIAAGMFLAMAIYGTVTRKDLSGWRNILVMMLFGAIIASIVNIFLHSTLLYWGLTLGGVVLFSALTAYDTQKIYALAQGLDMEEESGQKMALLGALTLYLDFINLFLYLLRIFGSRRD